MTAQEIYTKVFYNELLLNFLNFEYIFLIII